MQESAALDTQQELGVPSRTKLTDKISIVFEDISRNINTSRGHCNIQHYNKNSNAYQDDVWTEPNEWQLLKCENKTSVSGKRLGELINWEGTQKCESKTNEPPSLVVGRVVRQIIGVLLYYSSIYQISVMMWTASARYNLVLFFLIAKQIIQYLWYVMVSTASASIFLVY